MLSALLPVGCPVRPSVETIAEKIRIGTEWSELRPDRPLVVEEQVQRISVEVPDAAAWDLRPDGGFVRPDGKPVTIDVELVARGGERFRLNSFGLGPGLTFSYLPAERDPKASRLPPGMEFVAVRFRADSEVTGGRVTWICLTNY